jgi:Mn2+/Fe2+ NRAMP family transporter
VDVSWGGVLRALVWPRWSAEPHYLLAVVAALGTTISPYLFFWQAQQEVEAGHNGSGATALLSAAEARNEFARIRFDTVVGMGLSSVVALFIVITSAAALHARGITNIQTAAEAAEALRAVAGRFTLVLFALGILGAGLLVLPALTNSTAYAVGELLSWPVGRSRGPRGAPAFYVAIVGATAIACALNLTSVNPMRALYWSAVLNGVIAVPLMCALMHMSARESVVGALCLPRGLRLLGWLATVVMAACVASLAVAVFL